MKNSNMVRHKSKTENFQLLLSMFRDGMEKERLTTPENVFAKKYHISNTTLIKLMGPTPIKPSLRGGLKIILNVEEVNKMRLTMSDHEIARYFKTWSGNLNSQCGTRKELGIPVVAPKLKKEFRLKERQEKTGTVKKQDRWTYPDETEYEKAWKKDAISMGPIKILFSKINNYDSFGTKTS